MLARFLHCYTDICKALFVCALFRVFGYISKLMFSRATLAERFAADILSKV